jgi:protein-tyrosine phosphatase
MDTASPTRALALEGVFNFRDLGGWPTDDGHTVRWRRIFRADGLGRLTPGDLEALAPIGLRTVIDLRTANELDTRGRFPIDAHPVDYHHLPVIDRTWDRDEARRENLPATEFLHRAYREILAEGAPRYAAALTVLAGDEALPAVFHCAAGKDRTGLMAALVLGAVGVARDAIVEDYALTQETIDRFVARAAAEDPEVARNLADMPRAFLLADPSAMSLVLDDLEGEHGTVAEYVRSIGVVDDVLQRLRNRLLEPRPAS